MMGFIIRGGNLPCPLDKVKEVLAANPDSEEIIGLGMREVFYNAYERKFGSPTADVIER